MAALSHAAVPQALAMPERVGFFCSLLGFDRGSTVPVLQGFVDEQRAAADGDA